MEKENMNATQSQTSRHRQTETEKRELRRKYRDLTTETRGYIDTIV